MTSFRAAAFALVLTSSAIAAATGWRHIEPGVTSRSGVTAAFGPPARTVRAAGKEILVYLDSEGIKGTKQAQFRIDPETQLVERIDVFPLETITLPMVEATFGPPCSQKSASTCYLTKRTGDSRSIFYPSLDLAVFFEPNGRTIHSLVYLSKKTTAPSSSANAGNSAKSSPTTESATSEGEHGVSGPSVGRADGGSASSADSVTPARREFAGEVTGYADSRFQFTRANVTGVLPANDEPELLELLELNIQLKQKYSEDGFVYGDLSLFGQWAGVYRQLGPAPDWSEQAIASHPVVTTLPFISITSCTSTTISRLR